MDIDFFVELRWRKAPEGRNIYIRPAGEHSLSLVDDASIQVIERLKSQGFAPAVVLRNFTGELPSMAAPRTNSGRNKNINDRQQDFLASRFGCDLASAGLAALRTDSQACTNRKDKTSKDRWNSFPMFGWMRQREGYYPNAAHFVAEVKRRYGNRTIRSFKASGCVAAEGVCARRVSKPSSTFARSPSTVAIRPAWISPMPSTLWARGVPENESA